jgi:hypothetical protein
LRLQKQKELADLHLINLSKVVSSEDYNLLVRGKKPMTDSEGNLIKKVSSQFKLGVGNRIETLIWEKTSDFIPNSFGDYGVPLCYISQSISLNDMTISMDFSKEHGWTLELWAEYLDASYTEGKNKFYFWLDHTFKSYVSLKLNVLPLYFHSMNKHKDWSRFLAVYNRKFNEWENIFTDTEFTSDSDCICVYSLSSMVVDYSKLSHQNEVLKEYLDHIAFILDIKMYEDERITGKLNNTHYKIIDEAPKIFNEFLSLYKTNSKLKFNTWFENVYNIEYHMKLEN